MLRACYGELWVIRLNAIRFKAANAGHVGKLTLISSPSSTLSNTSKAYSHLVPASSGSLKLDFDPFRVYVRKLYPTSRCLMTNANNLQ